MELRLFGQRAVLFCGVSLLCAQSALAQETVMVPVGGGNGPAVAQTVADPDDTPEEIAADAARDLKDSRFYNKPGATRAEYDAAWQRCRLIARGSRTPSGTIPYYYDPSVISPLAAGIGAGLGGLLGAVISEGVQRRANRRQCLMIDGWRLVEVDGARAAEVAAMSDAERDAYFNTIVGAETVEGTIIERTNFTQDAVVAAGFDGPLAGQGSVYTGRKVDPAVPVELAEGEGAIVVGFRRPDEASAGRSIALWLSRYDAEGRERLYRPRDWKKQGDFTTYSVEAKSGDRKSPYEVQVVKVTAGDYVLDGMAAKNLQQLSTNCFGAPMLHVGAGEVVYTGDFIPVVNGRDVNGQRYDGVFYASHYTDAQTVLATKQPALAEGMTDGEWHNQASYACAGQTMDRYDLPGFAALPPVVNDGGVAADAGMAEAADAVGEATAALEAEAETVEGTGATVVAETSVE